MASYDLRPETRLIHAGERERRICGAVTLPIFQSTVFELEPDGYDDLKYIRYNNLPNHDALAEKLAALEGAQAALVTGSGMAAISATLISVLSAGDHLLAGDCIYGGTHALLSELLPRLGVSCDFVPVDDPEAWEAKRRPETRVFYVETITNPLMEVPDLEAVVAFARRHGLVSMTDNTFATPLLYRPAEHGFDLSLHSSTKYLNGHSDLLAGAVIGSAERVAGAERTLRLLGGVLDPHACYLLNRGLKTLAVRVERQNASAGELARHLAAHPAVERVLYPGLPDYPAHRRAARQLDGFGGMLAFEVAGGFPAADRVLSGFEVITHAPSLGGVETLAVSPARSSHASLSPAERQRIGISDGLIRLSVGIEAVADLAADLDRALAAVGSREPVSVRSGAGGG